MTIHRINPGRRWSDITVFNRVAHFVEVADSDTSVDAAAQLVQILDQADAALANIGSDRTHLLSATIYVTDFADLAAINAVWDAWFPDDCAPSRACVKAELADSEYRVEVAFVAAAMGAAFAE